MDLLTIFTEIINSTLNLFLAYFLFDSFFEKHPRIVKNIIIFVIVNSLQVLLLIYYKGTIFNYICMYLLTTILSFIFKAKLHHRLTYTALFFGITAAIEMIVAVTVTKLFNVNFTDGKYGILLIIGMLLSKFIGFLVISTIKIKKQTKMIEIMKNNPLSILIFPISTFAIIIMQHWLFLYYPIENNIVSISVLACYSLLIVANIVVIEFINTLNKNAINENRAILAEELISSQAEQYKNILEHHKQISLIKHNHRNFCIGVLNELENGNITSAIEYITKEQLLTEENSKLPTDIINTIIVLKMNQAKEHGIEIEYETHQLQKLEISSVDLAVLLGNALDNAIEATTKIDGNDKKITILIVLKNNSLLVTIRNPVAEDIDVENLTTTKNKSEQHGFGILSMEQLARKYNGEILLSCKNNFFTTNILLNNVKMAIDE